MMAILEFLATACAGLFAGAALYINVAEHPARLRLDTSPARSQWAHSYERAARMQAPLAIASLLAALGAWLLHGGVIWLIAGLLIGAVVPFTLIIIKPTNRALLGMPANALHADTRTLLERWGHLHAVRTVASLIALVLMLSSLTWRA